MTQTLYTETRTIAVAGEPFYDDHLPKALQKAQRYAGKNGFVASMLQLLKGFPHAEWYTALSEDDVGIDAEGKFGSINQPVVITVHGDGILAVPRRIERAYKQGLTALNAAKLTPKEIRDLLQGSVHENKIQTFSYNQFLEESKLPTFFQDHPRYAVVRGLELAKKTVSGYGAIDRLCDAQGKVTDSQVIVYAGGVEPAQDFIERARKKFTSGQLAVRNPFNHQQFNPEQDQGRLLFLDDLGIIGLVGNGGLLNDGRFFGVRASEASREAPGYLSEREASSRKSMRAPQEKNNQIPLEEVLRLGHNHVSKAGRPAYEQDARRMARH